MNGFPHFEMVVNHTSANDVAQVSSFLDRLSLALQPKADLEAAAGGDTLNPVQNSMEFGPLMAVLNKYSVD